MNNTDIKFDEILIVKIVSLRPEFKNMIYSRSFFNLTEFLSSNTSHIDDALFAKNITNKTYSDPRNFSQFYQEKNSFVTIEIVQMPQLLAMPSDTK